MTNDVFSLSGTTPWAKEALYRSAITEASSNAKSFNTLDGMLSGQLDFLVLISLRALNADLEWIRNSLGTSKVRSVSVCKGAKCDVKLQRKVLNRSASAPTQGVFSFSI